MGGMASSYDQWGKSIAKGGYQWGTGAPSGSGHQWGSMASGDSDSPTDKGETFEGTVKAFSEEKGWGHIVCKQTRELYGRDIFFMRSALRGGRISAGDQVSFGVTMGIKGPQASHVTSMEKGTDWGSQVTSGRSFEGTIMHFSEEKGWGFVQCEETRNMFGKDIFVHKREFGESMLRNAEQVTFTVELTRDGRPEAKNVVKASNDSSGADSVGCSTQPSGGDSYGAVPAESKSSERSVPY